MQQRARRSAQPLDRMAAESAKPRYRPSAHIQAFFWIALLLTTVTPSLLISGALFDTDHFIEGLTTFALLVAVFQLLFWFACRRCSSEELGARDGLLYVTAYMTIGVGTMSLFVAVPCTIVAVVYTTVIAILSIADAEPARAQHRFH